MGMQMVLDNDVLVIQHCVQTPSFFRRATQGLCFWYVFQLWEHKNRQPRKQRFRFSHLSFSLSLFHFTFFVSYKASCSSVQAC